jgi:hypothetical protein
MGVPSRVECGEAYVGPTVLGCGHRSPECATVRDNEKGKQTPAFSHDEEKVLRSEQRFLCDEQISSRKFAAGDEKYPVTKQNRLLRFNEPSNADRNAGTRRPLLCRVYSMYLVATFAGTTRVSPSK